MPITEPDLNLYHVETTFEVYDELQALLLDHLLDHIQLLALIASCGAVPDTITSAQLAVHDRYRSLLDGSRRSNERLIQLIHTESQILLAGIPQVGRRPRRKRAALYRSLRELVPYIGYRDRHPMSR